MGGENKIDLIFGKYRAIKEIGRGATSVVYLAEEIKPGQPEGGSADDQPGEGFPELAWGDGPIAPRYVAIKVVDFTDDRSKLSRRFRKLFATEAAVTAQFDHPNIAKVYDWKMEDERAYLIMEYVEGHGLDQFVTMDKLLPMHKVVGIIFKLAMALDYAHRRGIVHRDIKPANALITKDDEVKLMDFGLALNIKKNVNVDSTFINGLGSPSYMSPEQIKGYTLNHQTDLYSLGVMFYQMLTGRLPFRGPTTSALVYKIINTEAVAATQLNPDIPDLSDKVIKKALEKDLYSRYRLGADMAKDLSAVRYQILDDKYVAPDDSRWKAVRGLPVLGALDDVDVWELLRLSAWRVLQPATVLMTEGEEGKSFGFVLEGELEVEKGERAIAKLFRGDIVGEIAYLDTEGGQRSATVTALNRVVFLEINPSAFAFATEELREEVHRLATNAMVKRLREATTLAKRASPLAVHPAATTSPDIESSATGAPVAPEDALGWGAFAKVAASITEPESAEAPAPVRAVPATPPPAASPVAAAPPRAPAAAPATLTPYPPVPTLPDAATAAPLPAPEPMTATARNKSTTTKSQVLVQPLPAAAAAMIAQMALGNQVMGKAAPNLQPFELGPETPDEPTTPVSDMPPGAMLTTDMGAHYGSPMATSEMAANFNAPPPMATSEIAPEFDIHVPMATTDMGANFGNSQQLSTSELAPRFDASQQVPAFDSSQQISTNEMAPRFDSGARQMSTSELAPNFDASQQFTTTEMAPRFEASPLLTTEMGAHFDTPPPAPPPSPSRASSGPATLRPKVREVIQESTQALAPEFFTSAPPSYPGAAGPADSAFDMDKTVELHGGFRPGEKEAQPEEPVGELMPPIDAGDAAPAGKSPPAAFRPTPPAAPTAAAAPAPRAVKPTPPRAPAPAPGARPPVRPPSDDIGPEDFDKTVILTGGFEAQPPEDDTRPVDDLFPPIKF